MLSKTMMTNFESKNMLGGHPVSRGFARSSSIDYKKRNDKEFDDKDMEDKLCQRQGFRQIVQVV